MTDDEAVVVERAAELAGISKSDYVRRLVLERARAEVAQADESKAALPAPDVTEQLQLVARQLEAVVSALTRSQRKSPFGS